MRLIVDIIGVVFGLATAFIKGAVAALVNDRPKNVHLGESRLSGAATWAWIGVYGVATLLCSVNGHPRLAAALTFVTALMLARRIAGRVGVPISLTQLAREFSGSALTAAAWFFTVLYAVAPVGFAAIADKHIAIASTVAGVIATWGPLLYIAYAGQVGRRIAKRAVAYAQRIQSDADHAAKALGGTVAEILKEPRFAYRVDGSIFISPVLAAWIETLGADRNGAEAKVARQWPALTIHPSSGGEGIWLVPASQEVLDERRALAASGGLFATDLDSVEIPGPRAEHEPADKWAMTAEDFQ